MTRKSWIDTDGIDEATGNSRTFWAQMRLDLAAGQFWADEIKKYREEPAKALSMALDHLPLPAAFRNAAVSARALIRMRKKSKETSEQELTLLYWLSAIRSFMLDYAPRLKEPGFNVVESIPGRYLCSLPYTYSELGFRELPLLNKTVTTHPCYQRHARRERSEWPPAGCNPDSPWTADSLRFGNRLRRTCGCGSILRLSA